WCRRSRACTESREQGIGNQEWKRRQYPPPSVSRFYPFPILYSPFPDLRHGRIFAPEELEDPERQAFPGQGREEPAHFQGLSLESGRRPEPAHRHLRG